MFQSQRNMQLKRKRRRNECTERRKEMIKGCDLSVVFR